MSVGYVPVQWNRAKIVYDRVLILGLVGFLAVHVGISLGLDPATAPSPEIALIRALGACAFTMLHVVLAIGPLARLDRRFLPLLYNRRHLGVTLALVALAHGLLALVWYHGFGVVDPLASLLGGNTAWDRLSGFPYQVPGFVALLLLLMLATTSHDFWLKTLSPPVWKALHMTAYPAYLLLLLHVVFGSLQADQQPGRLALVGFGFALISALHITAGLRGRNGDRTAAAVADGWIPVGPAATIPEGRARGVILPDGSSVAVFRYDGKAAAVAGACAHQGGPLAEGRIVDGCITCPWHGWQYRPEDGVSPPPFVERLATYRLRLIDGALWVHPVPAAAAPIALHGEPA